MCWVPCFCSFAKFLCLMSTQLFKNLLILLGLFINLQRVSVWKSCINEKLSYSRIQIKCNWMCTKYLYPPFPNTRPALFKQCWNCFDYICSYYLFLKAFAFYNTTEISNKTKWVVICFSDLMGLFWLIGTVAIVVHPVCLTPLSSALINLLSNFYS